MCDGRKGEVVRMRQIVFHNREKEIRAFMYILTAEQSLITFVYGPINSGKTALIDHLIKQLPEDDLNYETTMKFLDDKAAVEAEFASNKRNPPQR
jgi:Cdc6-like AAA superfamily ATPase